MKESGACRSIIKLEVLKVISLYFHSLLSIMNNSAIKTYFSNIFRMQYYYNKPIQWYIVHSRLNLKSPARLAPRFLIRTSSLTRIKIKTLIFANNITKKKKN